MMQAIFSHRSIRHYKSDSIPEPVIQKILTGATRASTVGNMQLYSIIATESAELRAQLSPCHFNQPMVCEAPLHLTFCADIHRFSQWCLERGAQPQYDNFGWFMNGVIDALLASQNAALVAENEGLGICYLGTTLYNAKSIAEILHLPKGVIPVMVMMVGYPAENPPLTDRLPVDAVVHRETYRDYTSTEINRIWFERENTEETQNLLQVNDLPNLARIFTEKRYRGPDNVAFSRSYFDFLREQGFFEQ